MTNHILMTGGFGFIGGHVIEILLREKDNLIHVVDNLSSNPIPHDVLLAELGHPKNLSYDISTIEEYCLSNPTVPFNQIYHLASPVGPAGILKYAGQMVKSIVNDIYHLIDLAIKKDAKLVDVSTSEVYGGGQQGYCSEELPKIVPPKTTVRLEYAIGKLAAETAVINTCKVTKLNATIVRPFNVAGPRQSGKGGFVLPRFIAMAIRKDPLTIFGDGKQIRAFTHIKDIADGIIRAMRFGVVGEAYNLGNPNNKICILDLAKKVIELVNNNSGIVFVDPKTTYGSLYEEANDKYPDARKAINELGWDPTKGVEFTVTDTYQYMKEAPPHIFESLSGYLS